MSEKLRLIVLGIMGRSPFAGVALESLHYLQGFRCLGHDVYYVEDTAEWPYDPEQNTVTADCAYAVKYIARMMEWCGMPNRWAYRAAENDGRIYGLSESGFKRLFAVADALINLTGSTVLRDEHLDVPIRVYLETDPGLPEIEVAKRDQSTIDFLRAHTHHFTFAENLGNADCPLPPLPFRYKTTRQPIVLEWFTPPGGFCSHNNGRSSLLRFTTVGNWKQETSDIEWEGQLYTWSKHTEFLKFLNVPRCIGQPIELALSRDDEETRQLLRRYGWQIVDALSLTTDILPYRDYIFGSDGEFTVAKDQNVRLRTGWFSERSASYLTAGKPVVTQDTGFGRVLPTGEGLFPFNTMEEILAAFDAIRCDYTRHSRAARVIAEEYFRAETVLSKMIDDLGV